MKIMAYILGGIIALATLLILASFAFSWWWDFNLDQDYGKSVERLKMHTTTEHKIILDECSKLISSVAANEFADNTVLDGNNIPIKLRFTFPTFVRYDKRSCTVSLYKVPGKGIGYSVNKREDDSNRLSWFNEFESWDRHEIILQDN